MSDVVDAAADPAASKVIASELRDAADAARDEHSYAEAAHLYNAYLKCEPTHAAIWVQYGHMLKETGDREDAAVAYRKALELDPYNADTHLQYGHLLKITGDSDGAAAMYGRALQLDPASPHAVTELNALRSKTPANPLLYCHWLWHGATVLCDGTVTCGLDDPFKTRNYGNVKSSTLHTILNNPAIAQRRENLISGKACEGCSMYTSGLGKLPSEVRPSRPLPRRLVLEPSIRCNIRCRNSVCDIANDATFHLRREDFMAWPVFTKLIDEVGPHISELYFYNYGEPFAHPRALDMLAYAKSVNPSVRVTTSTNGILLARDGMCERIVGEGLVDYICFTMGGVDQDTYARYHKAGSFDKALLAMRRLLEERRRLRKDKPFVHWRYLLFCWNDSDEHVAEALRLRDELGVDELKFMLSWTPMDGRTLRRAPGTPGFEAIKEHIALQDGYCPEPFAEAGLWQPEEEGRFGRFCWTGRVARVLAEPKGGAIVLRLSRPPIPTVPEAKVRVRVPWGEFEVAVATDDWAEHPFAVPSGFADGDVPVELEIDTIFSPLRHLDNDDSRDLGIKISLDRVKPQPNPFRSGFVSERRAADQTRGELPQ
jgi:tetratricopeptide (TPR) repeat protein